MSININDLASEINRTLAEYAHGVGEEMEKVAERVAKAGVKKLRLRSPDKTGNYRKGWRAKKEKGKWILHNSTNYQLTHLLEKGHAKVGGGRVAARVHITPVEEEMIHEYVEGVEEVIRG